MVPREVAIFWPLRSATVLMPDTGCTQSWAVPNSSPLIRNALPWPRAGKLEITAPGGHQVDAAAGKRLIGLETR